MYHMSYRLPMKVVIAILIGLLLANIYIYRTVFATPQLKVRVLAAGKGMVTLIQHPGSGTLLIDTGSDASILRALGSSLPMWQRRIDSLILTSTDTKSLGGLAVLTDRYQVPAPIRFGTDVPYGTSLTFDTGTHITVIGPHTFTVSYGATSLLISSTTPVGTYHSDGVVVIKQ